MKRFTITDFREQYGTNEACLDKIFQLRYGHIKICPKCNRETSFSKVKNRMSYQCRCCACQVAPLAGTIFEKTYIPLTTWFYAIWLQTTTRNGVAAKEYQRQFNISYPTALRMAHQIKILMSGKPETAFMTGVVEADESFVGGLNRNRHSDKKVKESQGRSGKDKAVVVGVVSRGRKLVAKVVPDTSGKTLKDFIDANVEEGSIVITDEWLGYNSVKKDFKHVVLKHNNGEYVRGAFHTNSIESVWALLKRQIKGTHIHVSKQHLQKYVDEVAFRYMHTNKQDKMFEIILSQV